MKLQSLLLAACALASPSIGTASAQEAMALRVGRVETVSQGTLENAIILVDGGKIVAVGEDLMVERGVPIIELPDMTVMPGLVGAYSRLGLDSRAGDEFTPQATPKKEFLARSSVYPDVLETGVTTLGLYPAGSGVAGQAIAIKPYGSSLEEMLVDEGAYLKMTFRPSGKSKSNLRDLFKRVDSYNDKYEKAKAKFDKSLEKAKKAKKDPKNKDKEIELPTFEVPEKPAEVSAAEKVLEGEVPLLFNIGRSVEFKHLMSVLEEDDMAEREFDYSLRIRSTASLDVFHVKEQIGELGCYVLIEPQLTQFPGTMRRMNVPQLLADEGAKLVFLPSFDSVSRFESWRLSVARMVSAGTDRDTALKAMTLHPAEFMGLGDRLGSVDEGKDANLVFFDGDPLELRTEVKAVMLEGKIVFGEVAQ